MSRATGIQITADVASFVEAMDRVMAELGWFRRAVFCDGEAVAEMWCRHHPEPVCGDYSRRTGREYRRRRQARARRRR